MKLSIRHYLNKHNKLNQLLAMFFFALISLGGSLGVAADNKNSTINVTENIIANSGNTSHKLTINQARAIFSLRARKWPDGSRITVLVLKDSHPTHKDFLQNTLKILPHQLRRHWDRYIYSGIGQGPVVVDSQQEMIDMVDRIPGAIGYVAEGVPHEQVITLTVH